MDIWAQGHTGTWAYGHMGLGSGLSESGWPDLGETRKSQRGMGRDAGRPEGSKHRHVRSNLGIGLFCFPPSPPLRGGSRCRVKLWYPG